MAAKVNIISKEMVKPSVPTPPTQRTLKLSLLDQTLPAIFFPIIFSYNYEQLDSIINRAGQVQLLKQSLSDILVQFYPLAGSLNHNSSIDCDDTGVEFIEAQVHGHLSRVLENPNIEELGVLLPIDVCDLENKDVLLAIQVNLFDCGGIAIGVCMSHKIGDFSSLLTFINAWTAIARGDAENIVQPNFNLASLFPPINLLDSESLRFAGMTNEKMLVRKFVFNKEKLDALKKSVTWESQVKDPTHVEALSSFIWEHFIENSKSKTVAATHKVNLRSRMNPTLSDHSFGNLSMLALALLSNQETEKGRTNYDLVHHLRSALREIDSEYIKKLAEKYYENLVILLEGKFEFCNFISWCRFPVYEVDFGWGKPISVCTITIPQKNLIIFMDTKCGEGIEAYVNMLEEDGFSEALSQLTAS